MMRIGLLGASSIAPVAVIGPASRRSDVGVRAVAARDPARAAEFAARHAIPTIAADYAELVGRDDIDVIYCALPAPARLEVCEMALAAGKALLMEKPFAADAVAASRIVTAAHAAGLPAVEAFHYRFHDQFNRALALVRSGAIGRVLRIHGQFDAPVPRTAADFRWNPASGGGAMMDLGCYVIHAQRTLLGEEPVLTSVSAAFEGGVDSWMQVELAFGRTPAVATCSMTRAFASRIEVEGDEGELILHGFVAPQENGRLVLRTRTGVVEEEAAGPTTYEAQLDHFVRVWRGEASPLTGGPDAIANMAVIDACREAGRHGSALS